jgi:uncharacterized protein (TIGR00251 family)
MVLRLASGPHGLSFSVKVVPGASKNSVAGVEGECLKVRLTAPPVEGKANQALIELFSKLLMVSKSKVHIQSGFSSKRKIVLVENYDEMKFREFLSKLHL